MAGTASAVAAGLELAVRFNPLAALVGATIAAVLAGTRTDSSSHSRTGLALGVLLLAWLIGDGFRVLALARDVVDSVGGLMGGPRSVEWTAIATWALGGLAIGYILPAWTGIFVGRRVTHGTGWLAAGSTTLAAAGAIVALAALVPA